MLMVDEDRLKDALLDLVSDVYEMGWNHGFEGQALLKPENVFDPRVEKVLEVCRRG